MVRSNCRLGSNEKGFSKVENVYAKQLYKIWNTQIQRKNIKEKLRDQAEIDRLEINFLNYTRENWREIIIKEKQHNNFPELRKHITTDSDS